MFETNFFWAQHSLGDREKYLGGTAPECPTVDKLVLILETG